MTHRERLAWGMCLALGAAASAYFLPVLQALGATGQATAPSAGAAALAVAVLVLLSVAGAIVAALAAPHEAQSRMDARERAILMASERTGGLVLAAGIAVLVAFGHVAPDPQWIVPGLVAVLAASQIASYALQIVGFRTS